MGGLYTWIQRPIKTIDFKKFINLYREPTVTYMITPNNAPEIDALENRFLRRESSNRIKNRDTKIYSDMILNTISGLFSKFYPPERIKMYKNSINIKMNDVVSYKIIIVNKEMKFYLTVPKRWSKSFTSSIKQDWGQIDITKINEGVVDLNPNKSRAMEVMTRHHYALSIRHKDVKNDSFYSSIASLATSLDEKDKLIIDYNIEPTDNSWKKRAVEKINHFKMGKSPSKDDIFSLNGLVWRLFDIVNVILDEFSKMIENISGVDRDDSDESTKTNLSYSDEKVYSNTKGYKTQIRIIGESDDSRRIKHAFKNIENSFSLLNGDNQFEFNRVRTKKGTMLFINAVKNNKPLPLKSRDIYFEKEMENFLSIPNKSTLEEYSKIINQDNFTRTEIDKGFLNDKYGGLPFAETLDKESKRLYFGGYKRDWWTDKGRLAKNESMLDDRSTATMVIGKQGSGKTSLSENQALYTFGAHLSEDKWKEESKSVVVFDVADGEMIRNIYNHVPDRLKDRVIILNHGNFKNPIAVNNADLDEFNKEIMKDEDYSYTLAEMEARLMLEILESEKSISIDRWFTSSLQAVHTVNKDWGYIEAMKTLLDDDFRITEVIPNIKNNERLKLEMETFHNLSVSGKSARIIETIENRFSQIERDQKLWDCIAQKPLRDGQGNVKMNFRKLIDGDENGAYMILIHIPKSGVSSLYRKFIFSHYFTKIWNVALSREAGFAGRSYRPETLVIIDEIHQILGIPLVAKLFIDLFKEPRKYSLRLWITLHGFSSFATAGRTYESSIRQSILDNGCNLIMLKGGSDSFDRLEEFLQPCTISDYNNLMKIPYTGIFSIHWQSKMHVFQAKLIKNVESNSDFKKYRDLNSEFLTDYKSKFGLERDIVRDDNLKRSYSLIMNSLESDIDIDIDKLKNI